MFIEKDYNNTIAKNGYLVLNLFSEDEIANLLKLKIKNCSNASNYSGLSYSLLSESADDNELINHKINSIIFDKFNSIFKNFESFGSSFINKIADKEPREFYLHQDWSYTDENVYDNCYTVWIPLQDTNQRNGCMYVLSGSHRYFNNIRSYDYETARMSIKSNDILEKSIKKVEMKKGQVLFFKQALFHGSFPNNSSTDRLTAVTMVKEVGTPLYYYDRLDLKNSNQYSINSNTFLKDLKNITLGIKSSEWKPVNVIPYIHTIIDVEMIIKKIKNNEKNN